VGVGEEKKGGGSKETGVKNAPGVMGKDRGDTKSLVVGRHREGRVLKHGGAQKRKAEKEGRCEPS